MFSKLCKDVCRDCAWYYPSNKTCQLKKCSTNNPYVTGRDRRYCQKYELKENKNEKGTEDKSGL